MPETYHFGEETMLKSAADTLMAISMRFTLCRCLHVIAELGIADALGDTPLIAKALAARTDTHPDALKGELTGKERTKSEFSDLLTGTGFKLDRVIDTESNIHLLEASVA
jgi:hypothetical protein